MKKILFLLIIFGLIYFMNTQDHNLTSSFTKAIDPNCRIKGNISISNGNKIYHVPGQKDYENTRIQLEHGERWFCNEEEAIKAGWKKAPR